MIRTHDGFKMRLETLGAQGVLLTIDDAPNTNRFNRCVEVLVTLPVPARGSAPMYMPDIKVEMHLCGESCINLEEAIDRRRALDLGIQLMPALEAYAMTVHAALQFAHPDAYSDLADQALRQVCKIAAVSVPTLEPEEVR